MIINIVLCFVYLCRTSLALYPNPNSIDPRKIPVDIRQFQRTETLSTRDFVFPDSEEIDNDENVSKVLSENYGTPKPQIPSTSYGLPPKIFPSITYNVPIIQKISEAYGTPKPQAPAILYGLPPKKVPSNEVYGLRPHPLIPATSFGVPVQKVEVPRKTEQEQRFPAVVFLKAPKIRTPVITYGVPKFNFPFIKYGLPK